MSEPHVEHRAYAPRALGFAIVSVSDSRTLDTDEGGALLAELLVAAGHALASRRLVRDDVDEQRAALRQALAEPRVDVILFTGGTGLAPRDVTPEAIAPHFEKRLPGFGETFRLLSHQEIGSAAMASRAEAGVVDGRLVFLLPGSPKACRLAMEKLILPEAAHLVGQLRR